MPKRKHAASDSGHRKRPRVQTDETQDSTRHTSQSAPADNYANSMRPDQAEQPSLLRRQSKTKASTAKATISKIAGKMATNSAPRGNIRKLAPSRPFPLVPSSVSASGPRSAHREGKNLICITRHTTLAAYLRRCKNLLVDEGYRELHLHAMGAAIPHLLTLAVSLPSILPFAQTDVKTEVRTGTVEVMDEVEPENENEDITLRSRSKGGTSVVMMICGGNESSSAVGRNSGPLKRAREVQKKSEIMVYQEMEQDEMDEIEGEPGIDN